MKSRILLAAFVLAGMSMTSLLRAQGESKPGELKLESPDAKVIVGRLESMEKLLQKIADQQYQLKVQADDLRREIDDIRLKLAAGPAISRKSIDEPQGNWGKVVFENLHPTMKMDVYLNGQMFSLLPSGNKSIPLPAGRFTYKVVQTDLEDKSRELKAGEIKTITMR